jgi:hypothetical protein
MQPPPLPGGCNAWVFGQKQGDSKPCDLKIKYALASYVKANQVQRTSATPEPYDWKVLLDMKQAWKVE